MIALSIDNISYSHGTDVILDKISFAADEQDKIGIVGVNGSGKSTLFKLILGEYEKTGGNVYISSDKTIGILRQDAAFLLEDDSVSTPAELIISAFGELLVCESRLAELEKLMKKNNSVSEAEKLSHEYSQLYNTYILKGGLEYRGRALSILAKMGFDDNQINQPIQTLSGGQQTRLALCTKLCREPDILLLDEPTNHLDIETLGWLESYLASYKKCILLISHDRYFLDKVTNKTLIVENHSAKLYNGNYSKSTEQRENDIKITQKHYKNQQKEIARQMAYIAQQRQFNRERNIIAAESRLKLLDKMEKVELPKEAPRAIKMKFTADYSSGNDVLRVDGLSMAFGENNLFSDVNFLIKKDERVFIVGPNGCGKSTLIKLILGQLIAKSGHIEAGYNVQTGYYDQQNQNLTPENTVIEELWNAYPNLPENTIRTTLAAFRFFGDDVFKNVAVLSGGERARLTLAKLILSKMNFLVLDEPTNHLDIDSKEALESALSDFNGTILIVSHDRYFINKLATRIIEIHPGEEFGKDYFDLTVREPGNAYNEFQNEKIRLSKLYKNDNENIAVNTLSDSKAQYLKDKENLATVRRAERHREKLQAEALELESELDKIAKALYGEAAADYLKAVELSQKQEKIEARLLEIYEEIGV